MTRLIMSTCGVFLETAACQTASTTEAVTFGLVGLAVASIAWCGAVNPLLDRWVEGGGFCRR